MLGINPPPPSRSGTGAPADALDDNDLRELTAISLHTPVFSEKKYRQAFVSRYNLSNNGGGRKPVLKILAQIIQHHKIYKWQLFHFEALMVCILGIN